MAYPSPADFRSSAYGSAWWRVGGIYAGQHGVRVCASESAAVALYGKEYLRQSLGRSLSTGSPLRITGRGDPTGVSSIPHITAADISSVPRWDSQMLAGFAAILNRARIEAVGMPWVLGMFARRPLNISAFAGQLEELWRTVVEDASSNRISETTLRVVLFLTFRRAFSDSSNPVTIASLQLGPGTVLPQYGVVIQEPESLPADYRPIRCAQETGRPIGEGEPGVIVPLPETGLVSSEPEGLSSSFKIGLIGAAGAAVGIYLGMKLPESEPRAIASGSRELVEPIIPTPVLVREKSRHVDVKPHARRKRRWQKRPEDKVAELAPKKEPSAPKSVRLPARESGRDGLYWARIARESE